ncbi:MAG: FAD-binding protein [Rubellimicrobium sp.]|nr:FAD-binding protein [Rubellimicrobium sp.]
MALDNIVAQELATRFGDRFTQNPTERLNHAGGESHHVKQPPDAVVWPLSSDEVAAIVRVCVAHDTPVIGYGLGSSLEGHVSAVRGGVAIDMMRMERILRVSPDDLDCTVEAGITREALNTGLRASGLFFPVDPGANATLGGMAATRASGTTTVRYGTMSENVLSLKVVTPEGEIIHTGARARKSSAGYDLKHLYIGSEGTLGIITELTLRLHGRPEVVVAGVATFPGPDEASRSAIEAIQAALNPQRMEYLDAGGIRGVNAVAHLGEDEADTLFFEFAGSGDEVAAQVAFFEDIARDNGALSFRTATAQEDRERLWRARHGAYPASLSLRPGSKGWLTDVCVPIGALAENVTAAKALMAACPVPSVVLGHVGDGNFHVIFALDPENADEMAAVEAVNEKIVARALASGGTCTGEHGVGLGKMRFMEAEHGAALGIMRRLKAALDPKGLFNPGKMLP